MPYVVEGRAYTNETLEFLGDAVLNLIAANFLRNRYPDKTEGELSRMRSNLVSRKLLNKVASRLHLAKLIAKTRQTNVRHHVMGNTLEAIFGAIFLDKGYKGAEKFFEILIQKQYIIPEEYEANKNYKSLLLEKASKEKFKVEFVSKEKKINNKLLFKSFVFVNQNLFAEGIGTRKKSSEQLAAQRALKNFMP